MKVTCVLPLALALISSVPALAGNGMDLSGHNSEFFQGQRQVGAGMGWQAAPKDGATGPSDSAQRQTVDELYQQFLQEEAGTTGHESSVDTFSPGTQF